MFLRDAGILGAILGALGDVGVPGALGDAGVLGAIYIGASGDMMP